MKIVLKLVDTHKEEKKNSTDEESDTIEVFMEPEVLYLEMEGLYTCSVMQNDTTDENVTDDEEKYEEAKESCSTEVN